MIKYQLILFKQIYTLLFVQRGSETKRGTFTDTDYFEQINEAGLQEVSAKDTTARTESITSGEGSSRKSGESVVEDIKINTKWENANGKSKSNC